MLVVYIALLVVFGLSMQCGMSVNVRYQLSLVQILQKA